MADEAYRAVFLRVHPTGKMVLSLTTEADGNEGALRAARRRRARRARARRQGRARRREPLRHRPRLQHEPVRRHAGAITSATEKIRAKAQLLAGRRPRRPRTLHWDDGAFVGGGRHAHDRRHRPVRPRHRRAPARRRGRAGRADRLPRLNGSRTRERDADRPHHGPTGKGGAAAKAGHDLTIVVERWSATLESPTRSRSLEADARSLRVRRRQRRISPLGDEREGRDQADDRRGGAQGPPDQLPLHAVTVEGGGSRSGRARR